MRKIREAMRLRAAGHSVDEIAHSVGVGKTTISEYLLRAQAAGLSWPLPDDLDDAQLEDRLYPPPTAELFARRPVPDWREVHRELKRGRHVTRRLLWMEWRQAHPDGFGYSQFCYGYERWVGLQDLVMRLEYAAGERLFVDYAGDKMFIVDPQTGEVTVVEVFVAVLGGSGLIYVEAARGQDLKSWLMAHVRAFEFFGGVPRLVIPDNLKSGVVKACWYEPEINRSYLELARHFDTAILPTRAAHPRDKAIVEVGVQVVERWVTAPLRNRRFFSLAELNLAIAEKRGEVNNHRFRGLPTSRRELFEDIERKALRPLPQARYEFAEIKVATANIDYHVEFDHHFYSVPYQLVRQKLEVRATAATIEVYHRNRRVASHIREHGRRRYITDDGHRPATHRAYLEWTPSRLIEWAATVGPEVGTVAERILLARPHPEQGYRACLGLMSLAKKYGPERVAAASVRALAMNAVSYTSIKSILQQSLDRVPLPGPQLSVVPAPPVHENLRGAGYYGAGEA